MNQIANTILVIGGAGYIGSHACKAVAAAGFIPIVYDNFVSGHRWAVKWGPLEIGDINDSVRLGNVIKKYRPIAVMHFAAYAYVGESVRNPGRYYSNNVSGSIILLEAMRDHGIDKLIFSSTCATYGIPEYVPIREDHPQRPINPYGASKLMVERILQDFDSAYGLRSISLRYFNAAGADPDGEIGEAHEPETHLIPLVLDATAGRRPPLMIFGDDYDTPDGTCVRDYVHVSDLANAHVLALKALISGATSTAYNLGNGKGFSVREVIDSAARISGLQVPFSFGPRRKGDPATLVGDATCATKELGWSPHLNNIDEIIYTAWQWQNICSVRVMK